jgi:hypothetical protein
VCATCRAREERRRSNGRRAALGDDEVAPGVAVPDDQVELAGREHAPDLLEGGDRLRRAELDRAEVLDERVQPLGGLLLHDDPLRWAR